MNYLKKVFSFFHNLFYKKEVKMIEAPIANSSTNEKNEFIQSLRVNVKKSKKSKRIETLTCVGDGLGIQNKITN